MPRRYMTQIMVVAPLMAMTTYVVVSSGLRPGSWNAGWMFGPPIVIGLSLNRSYARLAMTGILPLTACIVISITGIAMGGI